MVVFDRIINTQSIRRTQQDPVMQGYNMLVENPVGIKSPARPSMRGTFKMGFKKKKIVK